jgi:uncharacterized protein YdhG (YjbR/CyaY superfamily)
MAAKKSPATIDEYLNGFPMDTQVILENLRHTIRKVAPDAIETISYGIPAFDFNNKHLVFFAAWKHHFSLYPIPAGDEAFQEEISHYKRGKGTLQIPLNKPVPYGLVERIIVLLMQTRTKGR